MSGKLFVYGCSFGKYGTTIGADSHQWTDENSFGDILSKKLNLSLVNRSWAGGSNFHIFRKVLYDIGSNNIDQNDYVIIQYSYIGRAWCNDRSKTVMPHYEEFEDYYKNYYSEEQALANLVSFNEYLKNKIKAKLVYSIVNDLKSLKKINDMLYQDFINDKRFFSINGLGPVDYLISLKSDKLILPCLHPSVEGHALIANLYYDFINKS